MPRQQRKETEKFCASCAKLAIAFCDQSAHLDRDARLLSDLCCAAADMEQISEQTILLIGENIRRYLRKRASLEWNFFGRVTDHFHKADQLLKREGVC